MAVCEKCGTTFEPQQSGEVTTLRILCAPCTEARAREKAQRSARAPAAVPARAPGATRAPGAPRPASPPSAPSDPKPAPRAKAPVPAARPVPAKAAVRPEQARRAPPPEPEDEVEAEAPAAKRRPARKGKKSAPAPRTKGLSVAVVGWIIAGVVVLGCGAALYFILNKKAHDVKAVEDYEAKQNGIYDQIKKLSEDGSEKSHQELIDYAAAQEPTWKEGDYAADITSMVAKSKNQLEKLRRTRELQSAMATIEAGLQGIESRSPEEIAELMRSLSDVEPRAEAQGADFMGRVGKARTTLDRAYTTALMTKAKAFAEANPDKGRQALVEYTRAEDEVIRLLDASIKARNKEAEAFFRDQYKELIAASDALVLATFTPEVIEQLPWKDLLAGEQVGYWNPAAVKGFSHHIDGGTITLVGPDADAAGQGMISIGDREQWRDLVVDMEFTLESGSFDLYFRLGQNTAGAPLVSFVAGEDGLVAGKSYVITGRMLGSDLEVSAYPEDMQTQEVHLPWTNTRKGGLGFALAEGTRLKVTRLRVHELRQSGQ